jgi:ATP-dependent exoDNAse (exonuclease V) beta subunit
MKYSNDKRVRFDNETHSYFLNDKRLISVTTLLSNFKNKFDSDFYSKKIALKEGKTQDEILLLWKEKAKKSCDIGTAIHKIFEDYKYNNYSILNNQLMFETSEIDVEYLPDYYTKHKVALSFINDFFETKRLIPIESEMIVYNELIAGQIDMICKDVKNNFYILDFKTNSTIDKYSYNKKMIGFFSELNDSNYYHYCIQLSVYKKLLKEYKINKIYIIHILENNYKIIECEDVFEKINFNYLIEYLNKKTNF